MEISKAININKYCKSLLNDILSIWKTVYTCISIKTINLEGYPGRVYNVTELGVWTAWPSGDRLGNRAAMTASSERSNSTFTNESLFSDTDLKIPKVTCPSIFEQVSFSSIVLSWFSPEIGCPSFPGILWDDDRFLSTSFPNFNLRRLYVWSITAFFTIRRWFNWIFLSEFLIPNYNILYYFCLV